VSESVEEERRLRKTKEKTNNRERELLRNMHWIVRETCVEKEAAFCYTVCVTRKCKKRGRQGASFFQRWEQAPVLTVSEILGGMKGKKKFINGDKTKAQMIMVKRDTVKMD
jgi:hypothetical protein